MEIGKVGTDDADDQGGYRDHRLGRGRVCRGASVLSIETKGRAVPDGYAVTKPAAGARVLVIVTSIAVASAGTVAGSATLTDPLRASGGAALACVSIALTGVRPTNLPEAVAALGENSPEISITM